MHVCVCNKQKFRSASCLRLSEVLENEQNKQYIYGISLKLRSCSDGKPVLDIRIRKGYNFQ